MSQELETTDEKMSKVIESLNLHRLLPEICNVSSAELKNSLLHLGDKVIVSKFSENPEVKSPADTTTEPSQTGTANADEEVKEDATKAEPKKPHDEKIFNLSCCCSECFRHRETIIQLYVEDVEYNKLWNRLQAHLLKFYDLIPQDPSSPIFMKYKELMDDHHSKWLSDGFIDLKNNIRLSLGTYLPLSNEMICMILYNRDPHQLFELICIQMQAVVLAYTEGLKNILRYNAQREVVDYNPSDLLNYIFEGYTKICHCERTLSALFFELEAGHLLHFRVSLSLVYKRMYQRWIFLELQKLVPECIMKLKAVDQDDTYTLLVQKFIKFDDVMTTVTQTWRDIWLMIQTFHKTRADMSRRRRIATVHAIFQSIRDSELEVAAPEDEGKPLVDWITVADRAAVWQYVMHKIKREWKHCTNPRLTAKMFNLNCSQCKSQFVPHYVACPCRTCIIAGGPCFSKIKEATRNSLCAKCNFFEKGDIRELTSNGNSKLYHLSWAVFRHLQDRKPYTSQHLEMSYFCAFQEYPCTRFACQIAANIITQIYPPNFSRHLLQNYRPLDELTRKSIMTIQNIDLRTIQNINSENGVDAFAKKLHPLHVMDKAWVTAMSNEESIKKASALAEGFLTDFPIPSNRAIFSCFSKHFRLAGGDIEFSLEPIVEAKKHIPKELIDDELSAHLKNLELKLSSKRDEKRGTIEGEIKKPLVEALQLAASNKKLEAELRSLQKEHSMLKDMVRDLEHIHDEKTCTSDHDSVDDPVNGKNASSHRAEGQCICYYCTIFGQSDCAHNNRANETRDRLRKRLREIQSTKKVPQVKVEAKPRAPKAEQKPPLPPSTPISCAPVDDILKFIEGRAPEVDPKEREKQKLKKAKQRQRKLEQKKVTELEELRQEYLKLCSDEADMRKTVRSLKKRKNKTRLFETEESLRRVLSEKERVLGSVQELVEVVREMNPEFVWEELEKTPEEEEKMVPEMEADSQVRNCEISMDPAKRMVTIRRINLPYSEPQVTVTAKGSSPDQDQLLYTFINGQIVPANSSSAMFQRMKAAQASQYPANYFQQTPNVSASLVQAPVATETKPQPVETQQKKKKNALELQKIQDQIKKQQQKLAEKQREKEKKEERRENRAKKDEKVLPPPQAAPKDASKKQKKALAESAPVESKSKKKGKEAVTKEEPPKKTKKQLKQERKLQQRQQEERAEAEEKTQVPVVRKEKKKPYIDPEFDNNTFKLLNLDESETEESDESFVKVETPPRIPTPPPVQKSKKEVVLSQPKEPKKIPVVPQSEKKVPEQRKKSLEEPKKSVKQLKETKKALQEPPQSRKQQKKAERRPKAEPQADPVTGVSIMEQLSRGIRVEGLQLPPGITLTRVDPASLDAMKAKKESISKIAQPMKPPSPVMMPPPPQYYMRTPSDPSYLMVNPMAGHQDNIIMVDTPTLVPEGGEGEGKKRRRRRRYGRGPKKQPTEVEVAKPGKSGPPASVQKGKEKSAQMVTLRNPMFDSVTETIKKAPVTGSRPPMTYDQPAAIIKNENGMFTIRNPALHQALSQGQVNNLPHYNAYCNANSSGGPPPQEVPFFDSDNDCEAVPAPRKCNSVIGSEIKTAHQIKQAQAKGAGWGMSSWNGSSQAQGGQFEVPPQPSHKSYSPFEYANGSTNGNGGAGMFPGAFPSENGGCCNGGGGHYNGGSYNYSPPLNHQQNFYGSENGSQGKFEESSFLKNLQPGQRLNSEVTIHNIHEAKFLRAQQQQSNGVEITRIPAQSNGSHNSEYLTESITLSDLLNTPFFQEKGLGLGDYLYDNGENLFGNGSMGSQVTQMEDDQNNDEFFNNILNNTSLLNRAPGVGKPSGNAMHHPPPVDSPNSSLFGEITSSLSSNTPPSTDDLYHDLGSVANSDPMLFMDANPQGLGVIGGELKAATNANIAD